MPFSRLRVKDKLKVADSIHLASAALRELTVFDWNKQLMCLEVPGMQFIADFNTRCFETPTETVMNGAPGGAAA
jgi:hypothetical protein